MRRFNVPEDSAPIRDPAEEELEKAIKLLKPIREHRRMMAERQVGREKRLLEELRQKQETAQSRYDEARAELPNQRRALAEQYQGNQIDREEINNWKGREGQLIEAVDEHLVRLRQRHKDADAQQQKLDAAREEVIRQQREAERMKFMEEELNG